MVRSQKEKGPMEKKEVQPLEISPDQSNQKERLWKPAATAAKSQSYKDGSKGENSKLVQKKAEMRNGQMPRIKTKNKSSSENSDELFLLRFFCLPPFDTA